MKNPAKRCGILSGGFDEVNEPLADA